MYVIHCRFAARIVLRSERLLLCQSRHLLNETIELDETIECA